MSDDNFFIPTSENVEKFSIPDSPLYQSDGNSYFTINSLTVNDNYFKNFNIKLFNGKYFNDDDYNTFDNSDEVPLIVGYDYSEIFKLDDTINFYDFYSKTNKTGKNNININTLKSKDIAKFRNKNFGFIFQYFGLLNDISVYKNVRIPLEYCKCNRTEASKRIDKLLERLGILDKKKYTPKELSGGQCQRVSIARALVNNPNIILADEPTGALDKSTGNEVLNILNEINKSGKTVIIVTHDLDIANKCSRIIKIEDGVIIDDKNI
ncbi:MAG: ATP-binding cassette domain-containing protein [Clostridium sp.]|nr:ATP-binding cassette domain-containing protein [Clostridium sp.]